MLNRYSIKCLFIYVLAVLPWTAKGDEVWFGVVENKVGYDNTPLGYIIDMVKLGLKESDISYEFKAIPFNRTRLMVQKGLGADVYLCTERYNAEIFAQSDVLSDLSWGIYYGGEAEPLKSLDELKGKKVIGIDGWPAERVLGVPAEIMYAPDSEKAAKMFISGRAPYYLDVREVADDLVASEAKETSMKFGVFDHKPFRFHLCWNKKRRPQYAQELAKVYAKILEVQDTPEAKALAAKHGVNFRLGVKSTSTTH